MSTVSSSTDVTSLLAQAAQSVLSGATKSTLDVNSLVSSLVTAKTAGQTAQITAKTTSDNTTLSAIGKVKSALSAMQTAMAGLTDGSIFNQVSATMSGTGITAAVDSTGNATAGNYAVNVTQIATANKISTPALSSTATFGTGQLTVGVGSSSMNITLDSSNNTLSGIASAINSASNNPGVAASIVTGSNGSYLVLTSKSTGAANTVSMSGDSGVSSSLNTATAGNFTTVTAGQDAQLTVDGAAVTSASNNVTGVLSGVTLNLTSAAVGSTQTMTVAADNSATTTAINSFVTAYNSYVTTASSLSAFDSTATAGSQGGPLMGDAMLNSITNGLASLISGGVTTSGKTSSLSSIGLDLQDDGTIKVDSTKLSNTLTTNPSSVANLFNKTNGIAASVNNFVNTYTQTSGTIDSRTAALNADLASLTKQSASLATYTTALTTQYNTQFTALNNLMTTMQSNTTYLNQLFGGDGSAGTLNK